MNYFFKKIIAYTAKVISGFLIFIIVLTLSYVPGGLIPEINSAEAAFNPEINYQGKLTNSSDVSVADGIYHMYFRLYTAKTGGSPIWEEDRSTNEGNRAVVDSGLFSIMLGSSTPLTGINFNQTLYLGVEIGGSGGSPSWDGEMSPRKILGAVPAAFVAENADKIDSLSSEQFLRSDASNSTSTATTFLTFVQSGAGKIAEFFGQDSASVLSILSGGNVGIGTTSPYAKLSVVGQAVAQYFTATSTTIASTFPYSSTTALTVSGSLYNSSLSNGCLNVTSGLIGSTGSACPSFTYPFPSNATSTNLTFSGGLTVSGGSFTLGSLNGPLHANGGVVAATSSIGVLYGGTGLTSAPSYGNLLVGNSSGGYTLTATSSLGLLSTSSADTRYLKLDVSNGPLTNDLVAQKVGGATLTALNTTNSSYGQLLSNGLSFFDGEFETVGITRANDFTSLAFSFAPLGSGYATLSASSLIWSVSSAPSAGTDSTLQAQSGQTFGGTPNLNGGNLLLKPGGAIGNGTASTVIYATGGGASGTGTQNPTSVATFGIATTTITNSLLVTGSNVGIGTTSPYAKLSVVGQTVAQYFTATSTTIASTFPYASTTALTVSGSLYNSSLSNGCLNVTSGLIGSTGSACPSFTYPFPSNATSTNLTFSGGLTVSGGSFTLGSLNGPLHANGGVVAATSSIGVLYGGTGLTSAPSYGNLLVGNSSGGYTLTATSSLGLATTNSKWASTTDNISIYSIGTGNVGIGTTTPIWKLQLADTRPSFAISDTSAGTNLKHWLMSSMGGNLYISTSTDSYATSTNSGLAILNNGNVGIGTALPTTNLTVTGSTGLRVNHTGAADAIYISQNNGTRIFSVGSAGMFFNTTSTIGSNNTWSGVGSLEVTNPIAGRVGLMIKGHSSQTANLLESRNGANTVVSSISASGAGYFAGSVGIASTTPWKTLSVVGTMAVNGLTGSTGASSICITSNNEIVFNNASNDCLPSLRSAKHNINNLEVDALTLIDGLVPVSFIYNQGDGRTRYGFIAEDTAEIDGHLTTYNVNGELSGIDGHAITSLSIKAIQQLNANLQFLASGIDSTSTIMNSSAFTAQTFAERFYETLFGRLAEWLAEATNRIGSIVAGTFRAKEQICIDNECLNKNDIRRLLDMANNNNHYRPQSTPNPPTPNPNSEPVPNPESVPKPYPAHTQESNPEPKSELPTEPSVDKNNEDGEMSQLLAPESSSE